jgi:hypothetical protein
MERVTLDSDQYEAEINAAYARGRSDERKFQRDKVTEALTNNRHDTVENYLRRNGWKVVAAKASGMEWIDPRQQFRVGLSNKLTTKAWGTLLRGLAEYHGKSEQMIQADILAYGRN